MNLNKQAVKVILAAILLAIFLIPAVSFAGEEVNNDLVELEHLIKKVNTNQSNPEKIGKFEEKLTEFFYDASPSAIRKLLAEFTPGETLAIVVFMKYSGKTAVEISEMRREGMEWDKIAGKFEVGLDRVIRYIKKFRAVAC